MDAGDRPWRRYVDGDRLPDFQAVQSRQEQVEDDNGGVEEKKKPCRWKPWIAHQHGSQITRGKLLSSSGSIYASHPGRRWSLFYGDVAP